MRIDGKSTRFYERSNLRLPVRVTYRESEEKEWTEDTMTDKVTICGVGFLLSRPVEPKRLIHLRLPMPRRFRLVDFGKEKYEVWGVVRYLRLLQSPVGQQPPPEKISLVAGVALIGAQAPESFLADPKTLYDLKPTLRYKSFWEWREMPRRTGRYVRSYEERQTLEIPVVLQVIDEGGSIVETVSGTMLNASESGSAVLAEFETPNPRFVCVSTPDGANSLLAAVRGIHRIEELSLYRLHLEFISGKWTYFGQAGSGGGGAAQQGA